MTQLIFAYTPCEIMPPYINISQRQHGKIYVIVRSKGAREVSEIELPYNELYKLYKNLHLHLGMDYA